MTSPTRQREHGTRQCYRLGPVRGWPTKCRCAKCRKANTDFARAYLQRIRGEPVDLAPVFVDATKVRAHLVRLERRGVGSRVIAEAAGVSRQTVRHLRDGRRRRCRSDVAVRILGAYPTSWPLEPLLEHLGRPPMAQLARRVGVHPRQLYRWRDDGLSDAHADRAATVIGLHPALVWPDW